MQCLRLKPRVNDTPLHAFASGNFCQSAASLVRPLSSILGVFCVPCVVTVLRREWPLFFPLNRRLVSSSRGARKRPGSCCKLQLPWSAAHHQLFPSGEPTLPSHRISPSNFSSCPIPFATPVPSLSPASASLASSFPSNPSKFPPNCPRKTPNHNSPDISSPRLSPKCIHPAVCRPYRSYTAQDEGNELHKT